MSDASELNNPSPAKGADAHPLDALTGGAFSAATSGDRAARIRDWLATQPSNEQLQEVFDELSRRDKGAARAVRERMDEIRRAKDQEVIAVEWAGKAQALLSSATLNVADAVAWQRDAAKAGAPLSREPLSGLKVQLNERVKTIEDLQHRVQVQREAAVLLAQRIEVLSTKPWRDAEQALDALRGDVAHWQSQAQELTSDASWSSVDARFPPQLQASQAQLLVVWEAFQLALAATQAAAQDGSAELPTVPVWADEIRVARGLPPAIVPVAASPAAPTAAAAKPKVDPAQKQQAASAAIAPLVQAVADAAPEGKTAALAALRSALKQHGRWLDAAAAQQVHEAMLAAGDAQGWQPKQTDSLREELIAKAEGLLQRADGQALGGRKLQESLRQLRDQWKQVDQGALPNHAMWKRFDDACNAAYKQVEAWLERVRGEAAQHKASRVALIEELKAWAAAQQQAAETDLKGMTRALRQFAERWRDGGHVGEKTFSELQTAWRQAMAQADAPLRAAQQASLQRREAMIAEAAELAASPSLRIDAVKALQQRWQAEAQAVPMDRKQEQKLWDAFRQPLDEAFNRKSVERSTGRGMQVAAESLSAHDRAVVEAAKALQAANASGDVEAIRTAMAALEQAVREQPAGQAASAAAQPAAEAADGAQAAPAAPRAIVAVRGDDRPGAKKDVPVATARDARAPRKDMRPAREERAPRGPRLGDVAFRLQRDAIEGAQHALRKLAAQAHGEALTKLVTAWQQRDVQALPSAQELGGKVSAQTRNAWSQAVAGAAAGDAAEALLRLEIAADVPTPAEQLSARRMLQLQLLTRRNAATPQETWAQDVALVLAAPYADAPARRLQNALKPLLRK